MASPAVDIGTGTTIAFATSSFTMNVNDIQHSGISRPALDTTHLGTTAVQAGDYNNATFVPGNIVDGGELTVEGHFNPDTVPPISAAAEQVTITTKSGATIVFSGFLTSFEYGIPKDDIMPLTVTVKVAGPATITAAS